MDINPGIGINTTADRNRSRHQRLGLHLAVVGMSVLLLGISFADIASASPTAANGTYDAMATLTGPITVGHIVEPRSAAPLDLAKHGYMEQEFFASGTASAFEATSAPTDGKWSIQPTTSASYRTRILVRRPANPHRFNGTVVVEWMNETQGESTPLWDNLSPELMRTGSAYVAVSAQALGIDGGGGVLGSSTGAPSIGLVKAEPSRYGTLHHPGDQYSYDIFAQIGRALREGGGSAFGGRRPTHVVAAGVSQSAVYLTTFADAVQPFVHAFDGIFLESRFGDAVSLSGAFGTSASIVPNLRIRTDLTVPVFMFETQTDLILLGYAAAQQPNTSHIRTWEVAGTSHSGAYVTEPPTTGLEGCAPGTNLGTEHPVVQAAFAAFVNWVAAGTPPPAPTPFKLESTSTPTLALDDHGNVIGGVRTPNVVVPVSTLTGIPTQGAGLQCSLFGSISPFSSTTLVQLYGTKKHYIDRYQQDLTKVIAEGYILPTDRAAILAQAEQVRFPS